MARSCQCMIDHSNSAVSEVIQYWQQFAPNLPAQLADSKQNCVHWDTTSIGTFWSRVSYQSSDTRYSRTRYLLDGTNYHASSCIAVEPTPIIARAATFTPLHRTVPKRWSKMAVSKTHQWSDERYVTLDKSGQFLPKVWCMCGYHTLMLIWKLKQEPEMKDSYMNRVICRSKHLLTNL